MKRFVRIARASVAALALLVPAAVAEAVSKSPPPPPLAPLPMLPSVSRVRVEVVRGQPQKLLVIEEVNLPRGDWKGESLDFYVAFGAPGAPRAVDVRLLKVADGSLEAEEEDTGEAVASERAARRPHSAYPLLGRDTMAGIVLHLKKEALARAFAPGKMATVRVRTVLDLPEPDAEGARSLVVRLGASRGTPLTLGRISATTSPSGSSGGTNVVRAEARLCGPDAESRLLAVGISPKPASPSAPAESLIAPVLAVRHASDDLCVRVWTSP
ncbi:hypothetical protein AKJ09_04236 [Labilithrix luteola]|uniref:Secreted protein n=1 Tax=Labilithrix luteola TaxID=1391654 RepID=A0A0K1PVM1_9BACT|nr:hypothetical protein [Labilithrix luteola]AKU97572.1 hypothetical protein AKJ09_04236 [Labilithrix luteola]